MENHGDDPVHLALPPPPPPPPKAKTPQQAKTLWLNLKLSVFKELTAPDRPLTQDEISSFYKEMEGKFEQLPGAEHEEWRRLAAAKRLGNLLPRGQALPIADDQPAAFVPMWGVRAQKGVQMH
eukprot:2165396-Pyramimonas_sp.AAC.1